MKLTCCQCSRVILGAPRTRENKAFCNNDFCLEEYRKVQQGIYRYAKCDFPDFNGTYPPSEPARAHAKQPDKGWYGFRLVGPARPAQSNLQPVATRRMAPDRANLYSAAKRRSNIRTALLVARTAEYLRRLHHAGHGFSHPASPCAEPTRTRYSSTRRARTLWGSAQSQQKRPSCCKTPRGPSRVSADLAEFSARISSRRGSVAAVSRDL